MVARKKRTIPSNNGYMNKMKSCLNPIGNLNTSTRRTKYLSSLKKYIWILLPNSKNKKTSTI